MDFKYKLLNTLLAMHKAEKKKKDFGEAMPFLLKCLPLEESCSIGKQTLLRWTMTVQLSSDNSSSATFSVWFSEQMIRNLIN